uniref:Uncharacterized protein n=1 Tax=Arundo donax TaxID=35708 RepID=A0A0A9HKC9_ARUDO
MLSNLQILNMKGK